MKILRFWPLAFLPALLFGQSTPASTIYIGGGRPMTRTQFYEAWNDSSAALEARLNSSMGDSVRSIEGQTISDSIAPAFFFTGTAGDTTSPGFFYSLSAAGTWSRTSTATDVKAMAVSVDSVNKGGTAKFQYHGMYTLARWRGLFAPGLLLVSDSVNAGGISPVDSTRTATKKMQVYATSIDSATGKILLHIDPAVWVWED